VEPLLNSDYSNHSPQLVLHQGALRWNYAAGEWWRWGTSRISGSPTAAGGSDGGKEDSDGDVLLVHTAEGDPPSSFFKDGPGRPRQTVAVDRLDYAIQESAFESMNEFLSAIRSHFSYWDCEDVMHFIVDKTLESFDATTR